MDGKALAERVRGEVAKEVAAIDRPIGLATVLVCSASPEQTALLELADIVVDGPPGVLDLLRQLTSDAASIRA